MLNTYWNVVEISKVLRIYIDYISSTYIWFVFIFALEGVNVGAVFGFVICVHQHERVSACLRKEGLALALSKICKIKIK
jgi:hypothetical protein